MFIIQNSALNSITEDSLQTAITDITPPTTQITPPTSPTSPPTPPPTYETSIGVESLHAAIATVVRAINLIKYMQIIVAILKTITASSCETLPVYSKPIFTEVNSLIYTFVADNYIIFYLHFQQPFSEVVSDILFSNYKL